MLLRRAATRLLAIAIGVCLSAGFAFGQNPNCGQLLASSQVPLPLYSGTLPGSGDMSVGSNADYLYILTQWGMARGTLTSDGGLSGFTQVVIGNEGGSGNGGIIPILCDCHQGGNNMAVAEGAGGSSRLISDWQPFGPGQGLSGLAAQLAQTTGVGSVTFGNQVNLGSDVPLGSRMAAIYISSSSKYYGYFPTSGNNVQKVDLSTPNGNPDVGEALQPTVGIGWATDGSNGGVRMNAMHVTAGTYDQYILVGATHADLRIHVAQIDQTTGSLTEVASGALSGWPFQFDIGVVNGRIFIASAEGTNGLQIYEFLPANNAVVPAGSISGNYRRALIRGPQPFPALFAHRIVSGSVSYIDINDTKWITQGGSPLLAKSLQHFGTPGVPYHGYGIEALVQEVGGVLTAHLYRELGGTPSGSIHTDKLDISCIAADPTAPPIPYATLINLSSQARGDGTNYFGDKWSVADASVSYSPVTELDWDFHYTGTFTPEKIQTGSNLGGFTYNPAYWPCDELNGGDLVSGTGCYQSLGTPAASYQLGLNSKNANGPGAAPFITPALPVSAPQLSIVGYDGNTLQVLAGNANNGDASASQGNTAEATFSWGFTPSGSGSGMVVTVPTSATAFSLNVVYKGGYTALKNGTVSQVDLVPNFSLSPNPVLNNGTLTLRNLQQKASAATVTGITYAISPGGGSGNLPSSFNVTQSTAPVTAPSTAGAFTITLTWTYTDHTGATRTAQASQPFSTITFTPVPSLGVWLHQDHTSSVPNVPVVPPYWGLTQGTTYYLFDDEPLNGNPHPGAGFYTSSDSNSSISSGDTSIGSSTGYGPATFAASSTCVTNCYFKIQVPNTTSGVVRAFRYTVTSNTPPPPGQSVTLSAPSPATPNVGDVVTFTAVPSGFTSGPTYQWDFGDSGSSGGGGGGGGGCPPITPQCSAAVSAFVAGPNPNTHTYAATGTYTVTVQATGDGVTKTASQTVTVGAGGPPSTSYTITGATLGASGRFEVPLGQTVTFSSLESHAASWNWDFGDGTTATGQVVTHAFTTLSFPNVVLTIQGDGSATIGTSTASIGFSVLDPGVLYLGNRRYQVRASWSSVGQNKSGTGTAISLTSDTGYFWFFSPSNLEVVVKVLDACTVDGNIWVFGGGLTNLGVQLTVTDTQTGATKTYTNTEGNVFEPIQDTQYEACPVITTGGAEAPAAAATTATPSVTLSAPSPANPIAGDTVTFTATPADFTGTVTYLWDFGDSCPPVIPNCTGGGAAAGPATNTHTYQGAGTYTVTVTASAGSQVATATQTVVVSAVSTTPRPSVSYSISGASLSTGGAWRAPVNASITLTANEVHGTYLWDFGNNETYTTQSVTHTFNSGGTPSVTLTVTGDGTNTAGTSAITIRFIIIDPYTLHLDGGRFNVSVAWTSSTSLPSSGQGTATSLSDDTGYFWFFNSANTEVVVKVLDACTVDGHFWVFSSGLTNVGVTLTVTDTQTGTSMTYTSADGQAYQPVQDFTSFISCTTGGS